MNKSEGGRLAPAGISQSGEVVVLPHSWIASKERSLYSPRPAATTA